MSHITPLTRQEAIVGATIGNYVVSERLGAGAMGTVYLGVHPEIHKKVAIKVLSRRLSEDTAMVGRFMSEARSIAMLDHPNIVETYDFGVLPDGRNYYTMEYLQGETLSERLKREPLTIKEIKGIFYRICDALYVIHSHGIVHRDLKPSNIFLAWRADRPVVKLIDFGVAKIGGGAAHPGERGTVVGHVLGTPAYMSPEQAMGMVDDLNHLSDIFSLGVILYKILTDRYPLTGESAAEVALYYSLYDPIPIWHINPELPEALGQVVMTCLQKSPEARFSSTAELFEALNLACAGLEPDWIPQRGDPLVGQTVGHYRVERLLDSGGMGKVFQGIHPAIERRVAIKVLHEEFRDQPSVVDRFLAEARSVNRIHHPNVVEVFDFGVLPDGRPYMVLEFLQGEHLGHYLQRVGAVSIQEMLFFAYHVAAGLEAAHAAGIIHRDLKPENIYVTSEGQGPSVKLLDFGIAKLIRTDGAREMTATGVMIGTPAYMSPEQAMGHHRKVGPASDIYSMGIILYELLSGRLPFDGDNEYDMLLRRFTNPPVPLTTRLPGFPDGIWRVIERTLASSPAHRPQSAAGLYEELAQAVQALDTQTFFRFSDGPASMDLVGPHLRLSPEDLMSGGGDPPSHSMSGGVVLPRGRSGNGRWKTAIVAGIVLFIVAIGVGRFALSGRRPDSEPGAVDRPAPESRATSDKKKSLPEVIRVQIVTRPEDASLSITVEGETVTGSSPLSLEVSPGADVLVKAEKPGHRPVTLTYRAPEDARTEPEVVEVRLFTVAEAVEAMPPAMSAAASPPPVDSGDDGARPPTGKNPPGAMKSVGDPPEPAMSDKVRSVYQPQEGWVD